MRRTWLECTWARRSVILRDDGTPSPSRSAVAHLRLSSRLDWHRLPLNTLLCFDLRHARCSKSVSLPPFPGHRLVLLTVCAQIQSIERCIRADEPEVVRSAFYTFWYPLAVEGRPGDVRADMAKEGVAHAREMVSPLKCRARVSLITFTAPRMATAESISPCTRCTASRSSSSTSTARSTPRCASCTNVRTRPRPRLARSRAACRAC